MRKILYRQSIKILASTARLASEMNTCSCGDFYLKKSWQIQLKFNRGILYWGWGRSGVRGTFPLLKAKIF